MTQNPSCNAEKITHAQDNILANLRDMILAELSNYYTPESDAPCDAPLAFEVKWAKNADTTEYCIFSRVETQKGWKVIDHIVSGESYEEALNMMWEKVKPGEEEGQEGRSEPARAWAALWQEAIKLAKLMGRVALGITVNAVATTVVGHAFDYIG